MVQHIYFSNQGARLLGAYHQPEADTTVCPIGVIMLHGWAGYRIGAHQMFTKLGRMAEAAVFHCLRFDFRGRGDSEGNAEDATLSTMISDTVAAVDWMVAHTGLHRIALVGDCSGAEVAIGACTLRPQIDSMVLWSAPTVGADRTESDRAKKWYIIRQYMRKLFSPTTWAKLVRGRLRFGMIKRALLSGGKGAGEQGALEDETIDWVGRFLSFPGQVQFIYGENDPTARDCIAYYKSLSKHAGRPFYSHVVAGANHAFYSVKWEEEVMAVTRDWLIGQCTKVETEVHAASNR